MNQYTDEVKIDLSGFEGHGPTKESASELGGESRGGFKARREPQIDAETLKAQRLGQPMAKEEKPAKKPVFNPKVKQEKESTPEPEGGDEVLDDDVMMNLMKQAKPSPKKVGVKPAADKPVQKVNKAGIPPQAAQKLSKAIQKAAHIKQETAPETEDEIPEPLDEDLSWLDEVEGKQAELDAFFAGEEPNHVPAPKIESETSEEPLFTAIQEKPLPETKEIPPVKEYSNALTIIPEQYSQPRLIQKFWLDANPKIEKELLERLKQEKFVFVKKDNEPLIAHTVDMMPVWYVGFGVDSFSLDTNLIFGVGPEPTQIKETCTIKL